MDNDLLHSRRFILFRSWLVCGEFDMTTPRDDIAGLSERLRDYSEEFIGADMWELMAEAATQLDALSARVEELKEKVSELKHGVEDHLEDAERQKELRFEAEARAIRAEQERDEAIAALKPMADVAVDIPEHWDDDAQCVTACGHFRRAAAAIRRLASGPEKEKKE